MFCCGHGACEISDVNVGQQRLPSWKQNYDYMKLTHTLATVAAITSLPLSLATAETTDTRQPTSLGDAGEDVTRAVDTAVESDMARPTDTRDPQSLTDGHDADSTSDYQKVAGSMTIAEKVASEGEFSTLEKVLEAANLVTTLDGEGPFTVFAPTDAAFDKVDADTLEALMQPENKEKLRALLLGHVVSGKVPAAQVSSGDVPTLSGYSVAAVVEDGSVMINDAKVIKPDIMATNGIVHVVDSVIMAK